MGGISHVHLNMTYREHYNRTQALKYTTYIRRNGSGYRLYNGKLIPESDFLQATALPEGSYISELNPCKKHQYLNVTGSCIENLENLIL